MGFEIERKFLVADDSWRQSITEESVIRQAYLTSRDQASIRVRIRDNRTATLTIKSRGADLKRLELEYEIPVLEAEAMLPLRRGAIIEKRRARSTRFSATTPGSCWPRSSWMPWMRLSRGRNGSAPR